MRTLADLRAVSSGIGPIGDGLDRDEAFKRRFTNRERRNVTLVVHADRAGHLVAASALRVRRALVRWLRPRR